MQKIVNVIGYIEKFKNFEDGTYNMYSGEAIEYSNGYQVSFVRPEAYIQLNSQKWDTLTNYMCEYLNSLAHIGVYYGDAEVSFRSVSQDKAFEVMEEYNQESILDWEKKAQNSDPTSWFILNMSFKEERVNNYDKILGKIL